MKRENKTGERKKRREFDYYIYIDYSENWLGYMIIERDKINEFMSKISKLSVHSLGSLFSMA